jgi:hypothetical protein
MFETLKRLFRRGKTPVSVVEDIPRPVGSDAFDRGSGIGENLILGRERYKELGALTWSADDDAWGGTYHDHVFLLGYDGTSTPSPEVRAYAVRILSDSSWLENTLAHAKAEALSSHSPFYAAEINALTFGTVLFSVHPQRGEYIIADLNGGKDFREWRIEFSGSKCEGIGFDS